MSVGVALVGHGRTASELLAAARGIVGAEALADIVAIDADVGETPELTSQVCEGIDRVDRGDGVLVIVDLLHASPCRCAQREGTGHDIVVLGGLNLAMLLKLAGVDRGSVSAAELAQACADSGKRAVMTASGPKGNKQGATT